MDEPKEEAKRCVSGVKRKLLPSPPHSPTPTLTSKPKHPCLSHSHRGGESTAVRLSKGQTVYVYLKEEAWREAIVKEVNSAQNLVTVSMENDEQASSFSVGDVLPCWDNDAERLHNLTHVNPVHEASILSCLHKRFDLGIYYTYAGNTVVAVNPYCDVSHLYTLQQVKAYHRREQGLAPHIYAVAENAYVSLVRELGHVDQSIIISGESGAGKTVSAKHLLRYLTIVANPDSDRWSADDKGFQIEQRVVDSNPILEAFGNAATTRNNNSSRFGKFIQLQFLRSGHVQGGAIQTYLLEKTRVVHQGHGENNFHVFYQMAAMETENHCYPDWVKELQEEVAENAFLCLPDNQECSENTQLRTTLDAMSRVGLSEDRQKHVFQVLLAILYLGNVGFIPVSEDSSELERSYSFSSQSDSQDSDDSFVEVSVTQHALQRGARLLGLNPDLLRGTLLHRVLQAGGRHRQSLFVKPISIAEAGSRRDILAMLLYSRLFDWLVGFMNSRIRAVVFDSVIGLLDIYGFEIFPSNSLEQLCINYANERLQQHYVQHFLKTLQMEYREEGLRWVPIDYNDNRLCVSLLDGRISIFSLLNEEVYLNRKSDEEALRDRLLKLSSSSSSSAPPVVSSAPHLRHPHHHHHLHLHHPSFVVKHYAGEVRYCMSELVVKNKDDIPADLVSLLTSSDNPFVQQLFSHYSEPESPTGRKKKTVLTKFKSSLDDLMSCMERSDVHYVRCLRPNVDNAPRPFHAPYVLEQLRACGTIESVDICRKGFPARMPYADFLQRYSLILRSEYRLLAGAGDYVDDDDDNDEVDDANSTEKNDNHCDDDDDDDDDDDPSDRLLRHQLEMSAQSCSTPKKKLRRRTGLTQCGHARKVCSTILRSAVTVGGEVQELARQFGKTKLFLTEHQLEDLEHARLLVLHHSATALQSAWRGRCCWRRYRQQKMAARTIARAWQTLRTRRRFLQQKRSAIAIQSAWRSFRARRDFLALKRSAKLIRRAWFGFRARRDFLALKRSAELIRRAWFGFRARRDFLALKRSAELIRRAWFGFRVRRDFLALKRSAATIQQAWRSFRVRKGFLALRRKAVVIQRAWRIWRVRRDFLLWRKSAAAVTVVQRAWRIRRSFLAMRGTAVVLRREGEVEEKLVRSHRDGVSQSSCLQECSGKSPPDCESTLRVSSSRNEHLSADSQPLSSRILDKEKESVRSDRTHDSQPSLLHRQINHSLDGSESVLSPCREASLEELQPSALPEGQKSLVQQDGDASSRSTCPREVKGTTPPDRSLEPAQPQSSSFSSSGDGNLSDDSGVMVHEPVRCGRIEGSGRNGSKPRMKTRKERMKREEGWGRMSAELRDSVVVASAAFPRLRDLNCGDGIVSRQRILKKGARFHTRASVLRYGHVINRRDLPSGLADILSEMPYLGTEIGSSVDP